LEVGDKDAIHHSSRLSDVWIFNYWFLQAVSETFNKMWTHITSIMLTCLALTDAVKINVASSGGNASSPLMYGIMFEVRDKLAAMLKLSDQALPVY